MMWRAGCWTDDGVEVRTERSIKVGEDKEREGGEKEKKREK